MDGSVTPKVNLQDESPILGVLPSASVYPDGSAAVGPEPRPEGEPGDEQGQPGGFVDQESRGEDLTAAREEMELEDRLVKAARLALAEHEEDAGWRWSRLEGSEALSFLLGDQWPLDVRQQREADGRPCLTINKLAKFLQLVSGEWRQVRPAIKVRPVDSRGDPVAAKVREGLIRSIEADSQADIVYQRGLESALANGWGWARVVAEYSDEDAWDQSLKIRLIADPLSVYPDPHSRRIDLSDCRYLMVTQWVPRTEFERRWPGKQAQDVATSDERYDGSQWVADNGDQVRVAEYWWREPYQRRLALVRDPETGEETTVETTEHSPQSLDLLRRQGLLIRETERQSTRVLMALVSGGSLLYGPIVWPGRYFPFAMFSGEEQIIDGHRYLLGLVQRGKDAQRAYNLARSYAMELMALSPKVPWIGPKGFMGAGTQKTNWTNSHKTTIGALEYDGQVAPSRQPAPQPSQAFLQEMEIATQDLKETTGIYDASLGNRSNEASGVAIQSRQQQGSLITSGYLDNAQSAIEQLGRILLDLMPTYYDNARIVRMLGEDRRTVELAGINGAMAPGQKGTVDLLKGRYDLVVSTGPSYQSRRQEAYEALMEFGKLLGPQVFMQMSDLVLTNADWQGSDEMAERLKQIIGSAPPDPEMAKRWLPVIGPLVQKLVAQAIGQSGPGAADMGAPPAAAGGPPGPLSPEEGPPQMPPPGPGGMMAQPPPGPPPGMMA